MKTLNLLMCANSSIDNKKKEEEKCKYIFFNLVSGVRCQVSGVSCQVSGVRCQVSGVRCQVSGVRCHILHVTCHESQFFSSFFLGQSGEASQWRVCYQRGLPHLVIKKKKQKSALSVKTKFTAGGPF